MGGGGGGAKSKGRNGGPGPLGLSSLFVLKVLLIVSRMS